MHAIVERAIELMRANPRAAALEAEVRALAASLAAGLGARGLLNLQLVLHEGELHVLEANPRASRTVPFVAKATRVPLV